MEQIKKELRLELEPLSIRREGEDFVHHLAILYNTSVISSEEVKEMVTTGRIINTLSKPDPRFIVTTMVQACAVLDIPVPDSLRKKEEKPNIEIGNDGAHFVD